MSTREQWQPMYDESKNVQHRIAELARYVDNEVSDSAGTGAWSNKAYDVAFNQYATQHSPDEVFTELCELYTWAEEFQASNEGARWVTFRMQQQKDDAVMWYDPMYTALCGMIEYCLRRALDLETDVDVLQPDEDEEESTDEEAAETADACSVDGCGCADDCDTDVVELTPPQWWEEQDPRDREEPIGAWEEAIRHTDANGVTYIKMEDSAERSGAVWYSMHVPADHPAPKDSLPKNATKSSNTDED